ncbi:MAG: Spermidine synthase-like protein [Deltaproteobacteria bacterium]|nr:Spermidine synthase-like protein [Deltaproteobacteria bacterium]
MVPWKALATLSTKDGELQLRQRGEREFLITIDGRVLMTSSERASEQALATLACKQLTGRKAPRVLIGGLGMAYTVRAALDVLPNQARITVAEITPEVEAWCRGPLAPLTRGAALDPRVRIVIQDVARVIEDASPGHYDAIVLDIYEGPHAAGRRENDPFYGRAALARSHAALAAGGVLAIWSEEGNAVFKRRMIDAGFATSVHHPGGSRAYVVYLGQRDAPIEARARGKRPRGRS